MSVKETLNEILNTVAFEKDADGNETSILYKAKTDLGEFLSEHTSISDDEKAKRISDFFTNTITNVTVQAIMVAGQAPLQEAQIAEIQQDTINKTNESIQKVISMKNEDDYREVQKTTLTDETEQKIASMLVDDTNKTNESIQKVISMQNDDKANLNNSAVNVAKAKAEIETLMPAQIQEIQKNIEFKSKQIETEAKQLEIADKDILLKGQQIGIEAEKIPLMQAQTDTERAKIGLTRQQVRVSATEVQYKLAQLKAIQKAGELNKEIEDNKNDTNIQIAEIYKG